MTAGGREFQVAGAAQLKDRLPISVRLNGTSRNGTSLEQPLIIFSSSMLTLHRKF